MNREHELNDSLAEKEILLSEIHHRVKNNLTAFISLLSLEGSYVETPEGQALKKDLQNRARTMVLIHETLYKTRQYSNVDMEVYLSTLVDQVVNSYSSTQSIRTFVDAKGVTLDLSRATPIGLIINELVTNSLKYAFPQDTITYLADRKEFCTIGIRLTKEDGTYLMKISDNGVGLPKGLDIRTTKSLGLKLVNFLARHQLRAKLEIDTKNGTEFAFRFEEKGVNK
jgi:two-component sensor histidine kinase